MIRFFTFLLFCVLTAQAAIIPADRVTTWQGNVGVPSGIPTRTTIFTNFYSTNTMSEINSGIQACPSNQVVKLAAGTYTVDATLALKSGVTLRGVGDTTKLVYSGVTLIQVSSATYYDWDAPVASNHVSILSGLAQDSTTLTVAATNLAGTAQAVPVGRLIFIDQLNDTNTSAIGTYGTASPGAYTSLTDPNVGADRYQSQLSRVVSVDGNTITISPGIYMPNYRADLLPQIWWEPQPPIEFAGVEDLSVCVTNTEAYAISFINAYACWSKNVHSYQARRHHSFSSSLRCEVRQCTMEAASGSGDDYTVAVYNCSGMLIEDNIYHNVNSPLLENGMSGSVFAYNYITNLGSGAFMAVGVYTHGAHPNLNLYEGNVGIGASHDSGWGSAIYETHLRNRWTGYDESHNASYQNYRQPLYIGATNRFFAIVGNVLGTTGINDVYESANQASGCGEDGRIYAIGYLQTYCDTSAGNYDPVVYSTLIRAYNWDSATSTNGGIVPGGFTIGDVPDSYYLTSKPSYFGTLAWPPIDPDNVAYSCSRTNIPAGYRFIYGTNPPASTTLTRPIGTIRAINVIQRTP